MKKISVFMMLIMIFGSSISVAAKTNEVENLSSIKIDIITEEFPDAYVETEIIDLADAKLNEVDGELYLTDSMGRELEIDKNVDIEQYQKLNSKGKVVAVVNATVVVGETYESTDDSETAICTESKLLNEKEVMELENRIEMSKITTKNSAMSTKSFYPDGSVTDTYYNLTGTFWIADFGTSSSPKYFIQSSYDWDNCSVFGSGKKNPSSGEDFIGFVWGGRFDSKSETCSITPSTLFSYRSSSYVPNAAITWGFDEQVDFFDYPSQMYASALIFKNTATGQGNTTAAVANYLHTYESHSLNPTIDADGLSLGMSSSVNHWNFAMKISGLEY